MASLVLTILLVLMVLVCALIGFFRGFNKSIVRMITLAVAIILAFIIAVPVTGVIAGNITVAGKSLGDLLVELSMNVEFLAEIVEYSPLFEKAVRVLPAFIIGIVVLPVVFLVLNSVMLFIYRIALIPLGKLIFKNKNENGDAPMSTGRKFAGLGVGAVTGLLIFGIVMTPLFGFMSVLPDKSAIDETMDDLAKQEVIKASTAEVIKDEFAVLDNGIVKVYSFLGASALGRGYLKAVSAIEYGDISTALTDEMDSLFTVVQTAVDGELVKVIIRHGDADDYYKVLSDKEFTSKLIEDMESSNLLRASVPAIMVMVIKSATNSLALPDGIAEKYDVMMDEIALLLAESDVDFESIMSYQQTNGVAPVISLHGSARMFMTEEAYIAELEKLDALTKNIADVIHRCVDGIDEETAMHIAERFIYNISQGVEEEGNSFVADITSSDVKEIFSNLAM